MYLLYITNEEYHEMIIINDENDLAEMFKCYINNLLSFSYSGGGGPFPIYIDEFLYYLPDDDKIISDDKINNSELIDFYECINNYDDIKCIMRNYEKIKFDTNVNIKINFDENQNKK